VSSRAARVGPPVSTLGSQREEWRGVGCCCGVCLRSEWGVHLPSAFPFVRLYVHLYIVLVLVLEEAGGWRRQLLIL